MTSRIDLSASDIVQHQNPPKAVASNSRFPFVSGQKQHENWDKTGLSRFVPIGKGKKITSTKWNKRDCPFRPLTETFPEKSKESRIPDSLLIGNISFLERAPCFPSFPLFLLQSNPDGQEAMSSVCRPRPKDIR